MDQIILTKQQARHFLLIKQGLLGDYRFTGKEGIMEFVRQAGCIQYDPIDVCGKNAELVLQSRIKGFRKSMLYELLYQDRKLIDYFDKNLAVMATTDWPYFSRIREEYSQWSLSRDQVEKIEKAIKAEITKRGFVCSKDIDFQEKVRWYWSDTKLSRAALETLYFRGDLIIHHKKGTIKYYALAKDYISHELLGAEDPNKCETDHLKWRVYRRIGAIGLLWNRPSDAWLGIRNLKAGERNQAFQSLLEEQKILEVKVEGIKDSLYCQTADLNILREVLSEQERTSRMELLAPLDNMLWDRKLIRELFGLDYKWEIYTPESQRRFGYYVLPILRGDGFIGRCEAVSDAKSRVLKVKNIWFEKNVRQSKKLSGELDRCLRRFMRFHELNGIEYSS